MKQRIKFPKQQEKMYLENIKTLEKQIVLLQMQCQALAENKIYYIRQCIELNTKLNKTRKRPIVFLNPYNIQIKSFGATMNFPIEKYENNIDICKKELIEYMIDNLEPFVEFNFEIDCYNPHIVIGKSKIYLGVKQN